jgi:AN1-type zinc finger protein 1
LFADLDSCIHINQRVPGVRRESVKMSSPNPFRDPNPTHESFTQVADYDIEAIGRNCQYEFCRQLDFLPFRCDSCRGTFCLDHRTETAHQCKHAGEWAARQRRSESGYQDTSHYSRLSQRPTVLNQEQCSHLSCKTLINTPKDPAVQCQVCNREYCLKHRLREEHGCEPVPGHPVRDSGGTGPSPHETIRSMFSRVRSWGREKTNTASSNLTRSKRSPTASGILELNELKRAAKGDSRIPADKRLYLHVFGTSETQKTEPPSGKFFFDSRWKVGRVLDDAARKLHIENVNNRGGGEDARLRIFHVESGRFLEFADMIGGGGVKPGHTIVLLRGAGLQNSPPTPLGGS